jgi:hypothetical protein
VGSSLECLSCLRIRGERSGGSHPSIVNIPMQKMLSSTVPTPTIATSTIQNHTALNVPPLTTVFTYAETCRGRWVLPTPGSSPVTVYSTWPGNANSRIDSQWAACQPLTFQNAYSPGVCPDTHTLATIVAFAWPRNTSFREWQAFCCPRYGTATTPAPRPAKSAQRHVLH